MKELNVTISGLSRSGKTTLAILVKNILEEYGIEVNLTDDETDVYNTNMFQRVLALKEKGTIVNIKTIQENFDIIKQRVIPYVPKEDRTRYQ